MNTPACGHSVKNHHQELRPPPEICDPVYEGGNAATADEHLRPRKHDTVATGLSGSITPWRQARESSGCPADDSIPSLSPCDAFMVSMSHWQGKSLCCHNIDRFACRGELAPSAGDQRPGTAIDSSPAAACVKLWLIMGVHWLK
jgi:hypothetical protein